MNQFDIGLKKIMQNENSLYEGVSFIPAQNFTTFIAEPAKSETFVVILHFNSEISHQIRGNDHISDEFIDKALHEMKLINLKKNVKHSQNTLTTNTKRKQVSKTTVIRPSKYLEIFDY